MNCDDTGPSHFRKIFMIPLHPTLAMVQVTVHKDTSNTLVEAMLTPVWEEEEREGKCRR